MFSKTYGAEFMRNVPLFALAQALMMSAATLIITSSALVGAAIADDKSLATLPLAAQYIGVMLASIPASMLMERIGRKRGFIFGAILGIIAACITTYAIIDTNFWLFTFGAMVTGFFNGFGNYYRFTAADSVATPLKSQAISWVMVGGLAAAFIGPNLANYTKDMIDGSLFAGSYIALMVIYSLSLVTVSLLHLPKPIAKDEQDHTLEPRPLSVIAKQPKFIVAVIGSMLGYGVMSLVMTATPLAMHNHHHSFTDTAFVIQWHVVAMFAPSFFTGSLIKRFSANNVMIVGALLGFACVALNLLGTSVTHFWLALFALGLSWNFLFIGGTSMLTETYEPHERAKTQAANDFSVFTIVAMASLTAGYLQHHFGWETVNMGVLPLLGLILASLIWLRVFR